MNPFAVFGLEVTLDLAADDLEQRHLRLSRECHPDLNRRASTSSRDQLTLVQRSAELNDAHRILKDRWTRAEAALEIRSPGVLHATKTLDPEFLMEAMELAEAVAELEPDDREARTALTTRLESELDQHWTTIRTNLEGEQFAAAATALHQSRYVRKALSDLALTP